MQAIILIVGRGKALEKMLPLSRIFMLKKSCFRKVGFKLSGQKNMRFLFLLAWVTLRARSDMQNGKQDEQKVLYMVIVPAAGILPDSAQSETAPAAGSFQNPEIGGEQQVWWGDMHRFCNPSGKHQTFSQVLTAPAPCPLEPFHSSHTIHPLFAADCSSSHSRTTNYCILASSIGKKLIETARNNVSLAAGFSAVKHRLDQFYSFIYSLNVLWCWLQHACVWISFWKAWLY